MPVVDLTTPPPPPAGLLDALPRRVGLTLPELHLLAARAGGAPLPFTTVGGGGPDSPGGPDSSGLEGRLGGHPARSRGSVEDAAYAQVLGALHDPASSLARRGLLVADEVDPGLLGAVGLLATPDLALDLEVAVGDAHVKAWHRHSQDAVATLATADGIVFEMAWFPSSQWPAELGRVAALPHDLPLQPAGVPAHVDLPFELADAACEAVRSGRGDLLPVLAAQQPGAVRDEHGEPVGDEIARSVLGSLAAETRGRLRVLAARVTQAETSSAGVVSWVLLSDGWHALRPTRRDGVHRVVLRQVVPADLASELAPVLAEVTR